MHSRTIVIGAVAALTVGLAPLTPAVAAGPVPTAAPPCEFYEGWPDFDADCAGDLAVGVPLWDSGELVDAGAVQVNLAAGGTSITPLLLTAASLGFDDEAGAQFGTAVLVAQVDGAGPTDLVIGAPGATVDGTARAGAVYVVYGAEGGLGTGKASERITESGWGLPDDAASFGTSLAVWSPAWDADPSVTRLVIGAPDATVDGSARAGQIVVSDLPALSAGLVVSQGHGAPGAPEVGDRFGLRLAGVDSISGYLAIGIPNEDVGSVVDAGAVAVLGTEGPVGFTQATPGVPGAPEAGDHFGGGLTAVGGLPFGNEVHDGVLVGVPGEDLGQIKDAGGLNLLSLVVVGFEELDPPPTWVPFGHLITEGSPGFSGSVEAGDRLGSTLSPRLLGTPYEDIGSVRDAGDVCQVDWRHITSSGRVRTRCANQDSSGVPGAAEAGDRFGFSVGAFKALDEDAQVISSVIGVPGEDATSVNQGLVVAGDLFGDWGAPSTTVVAAFPPQAAAAFGRSLAR